jgi:uncharacterized protein
MEATLSLTHNCNLSCKYCYSGRALKEDMTFDTARRAVDFILEMTPPEQKIEFSFFGGEPLLCFGLIKDITGYIREQQRESKRTIRLGMTTNGTLLTQSILDFLREANIDLCISIDGPEHIHNLNRCSRNGRGSFAEVLDNLRMALEQLDYVQVNAVYGPDTVGFLPETVSFFTELGASIIHLNPDICAFWSEDILPKFSDIYMQIADYYIHCYQSEREIAVNMIDTKTILFLKGGYSVEDMCGMGETEWGFAPSGNIYPCERFIGEDDNSSLCLGNVHTGLNEVNRCALLSRRGNHNEECKICSLRHFCMNWCGCTNYYMTGHTGLTGPVMCASEKAVIQAAKHAFITLSELKNELFIDHLMQYSRGGHHN